MARAAAARQASCLIDVEIANITFIETQLLRAGTRS